MSIQETHCDTVAALLDRQLEDSMLRTGEYPVELVITNLQGRQLCLEMAHLTVPYAPDEMPADGIYWRGVPVRVIHLWENHGSAA